MVNLSVDHVTIWTIHPHNLRSRGVALDSGMLSPLADASLYLQQNPNFLGHYIPDSGDGILLLLSARQPLPKHRGAGFFHPESVAKTNLSAEVSATYNRKSNTVVPATKRHADAGMLQMSHGV
jgi:hypothetical protein